MAKYLATAFSLSMLELPEGVDNVKEYVLAIHGLTLDEFCGEVRGGGYVNAVGHQSTAEVISTLCGVDINANRVEVRLGGESELLLVQLTGRPPEGKVYTDQELLQLYRDGKIRFLRVVVIQLR